MEQMWGTSFKRIAQRYSLMCLPRMRLKSEQKIPNRKIISMTLFTRLQNKSQFVPDVKGMPGMDAIVFIRKFRS
jgi:hypothetical protein